MLSSERLPVRVDFVAKPRESAACLSILILNAKCGFSPTYFEIRPSHLILGQLGGRGGGGVAVEKILQFQTSNR